MQNRNEKIVLGFAQWGEKSVSAEEMISTVKEAVQKHQINEIDCAPHYGNGSRECTLGVALGDMAIKPFISTKAGRVIDPDTKSSSSNGFSNPSSYAQYYDYTEAGILKAFKQSQIRLQNPITTLYLHDLDPATHGVHYTERKKNFLESGVKAFEKLKQQGKICNSGIGSNDYKTCIELIRDGRFHIDRIMIAGCYNLLNTDVLKEFFPLCKEKNIELYIAAPYCGGLLSGEKGNSAYKYQNADKGILDKVEKFQKICDEFDVSLPHAAMQFVLMHPQAKRLVVGARTREELALSLQYAYQPIEERFWLALKKQGLIPYEAPTKPMISQEASECSAPLFFKMPASRQDEDKPSQQASFKAS